MPNVREGNSTNAEINPATQASRVLRDRTRRSNEREGWYVTDLGLKGSKQYRNRLDEGRLAVNCGAFRADCDCDQFTYELMTVDPKVKTIFLLQ